MSAGLPATMNFRLAKCAIAVIGILPTEPLQ